MAPIQQDLKKLNKKLNSLLEHQKEERSTHHQKSSQSARESRLMKRLCPESSTASAASDVMRIATDYGSELLKI